MREIQRSPFAWYNVLRETVGQIECPRGCKEVETVIQLKEKGERLYVYCRGCMGIIYDSKIEEKKLIESAKRKE